MVGGAQQHNSIVNNDVRSSSVDQLSWMTMNNSKMQGRPIERATLSTKEIAAYSSFDGVHDGFWCAKPECFVNDLRSSLIDQLSWMAMCNSKIQGSVDELHT